MRLSESDATKSADAIIRAASEAEKALAPTADVHDWMFGVREIFSDVKRVSATLAEALNADDAAEMAERLAQFVSAFRYELIPHVESHLSDLESQLPRSAEDEDDDGR